MDSGTVREKSVTCTIKAVKAFKLKMNSEKKKVAIVSKLLTLKCVIITRNCQYHDSIYIKFELQFACISFLKTLLSS